VKVTLSEADFVRLESAMRTLLSPMAFETIDRWRTASRRAVQAVVQADTAISMLPCDGEPLLECDTDDAQAVAAYAAY